MKRAQVEWRCRRGTRELDLMLQRYLAVRYDSAPEAEQRVFHRLLDCRDEQLQAWLFRAESSGDPELDHVFAQIRGAASSQL